VYILAPAVIDSLFLMEVNGSGVMYICKSKTKSAIDQQKML
jgi:hypothetical protein